MSKLAITRQYYLDIWVIRDHPKLKTYADAAFKFPKSAQFFLILAKAMRSGYRQTLVSACFSVLEMLEFKLISYTC